MQPSARSRDIPGGKVGNDGLERFQPDDSFDINDHCSSKPCCSCPDDCDPDCVCLTPC